MPSDEKNPFAFDRTETVDDASTAMIELLDELRTRPAIARWKQSGVDALAVQDDETVIDIGCGTGEDTRALAERVTTGRVVGLDPSVTFLSVARRRQLTSDAPPSLEFQLGFIAELPFPDDSVDACFIERVVSHLDDPAAGLREVHRVLKPGGRVWLADHDNTTIAIDTPHTDIVDRLRTVYLSLIKRPDAGRRLYGLLVATGFDVDTITGDTDMQTTYDSAFAFAWPEAIAQQAAANGTVTTDEFTTLQDDLKAADAQGRFFASYVRYNVLAHKPHRS